MFGPGLLGVVLIATLVVSVILVLVAGRRQDDPTGHRTEARYLAALGYATLFIALLASFGAVRSLADLVVDHPRTHHDERDRGGRHDRRGGLFPGDVPEPLPFPRTEPVARDGRSHRNVFDGLFDRFDKPRSRNEDYRAATAAGLLAIAAGAIFVFHLRRRRTLEASGAFADEAPGRVRRVYFYAVAFTAALLVLIAVPQAIYGIFRIAAPGVYGSGPSDLSRRIGIAELLAYTYLAAASAVIFWAAWTAVGGRQASAASSS